MINIIIFKKINIFDRDVSSAWADRDRHGVFSFSHLPSKWRKKHGKQRLPVAVDICIVFGQQKEPRRSSVYSFSVCKKLTKRAEENRTNDLHGIPFLLFYYLSFGSVIFFSSLSNSPSPFGRCAWQRPFVFFPYSQAIYLLADNRVVLFPKDI